MSILLLVTLFAFGGAESEANETSCENAKVPNLTEKYSKLNFDIGPDLHSSYGIYEVMAKEIASRQKVSGLREIVNEKRIYISGARSCKRRVGEHLLERSTCPWKLMMTHDEDRYPQKMYTAECTCTKCAGRKSTKFQCEEIVLPMKVLRQRTNNGQKVCEKIGNETYYKYIEVFEPIVTGCTCSRKPKNKKESSQESIKPGI